MLNIISKNLNLQEKINIDPYIPINITWGKWNEIEEGTHYFRLGDFKKSLLEIGIGSNTGIIRSVTLVESNKVFLNDVNNEYNLSNIEQGIPVFELSQFAGKGIADIKCNIEVRLFNNNLLLTFRDDDKAEKCIYSDRVMFGANQLNELCFIMVEGLSKEETMQLNDVLSSRSK